MPTTNTNFTTLITAIDTKAQQLASTTTDPKDLVFLGKAVEALNVADTVSSVIQEGDTQVAAVNTAGTTQVSNVQTEGATQVAAVQAAGAGYATQGNVDDLIPEIAVTVANSKFVIDGTAQESIKLTPNLKYRFDVSDASNSGHPLKFSTTADGTHASPAGTEFTTGVTTSGTAGTADAYVEIIVEQDTPNLYYYCANHSGMGGTAYSAYNVLSDAPTDGQVLTYDATAAAYINRDSSSGEVVPLEIVDTLVQPLTTYMNTQISNLESIHNNTGNATTQLNSTQFGSAGLFRSTPANQLYYGVAPYQLDSSGNFITGTGAYEQNASGTSSSTTMGGEVSAGIMGMATRSHWSSSYVIMAFASQIFSDNTAVAAKYVDSDYGNTAEGHPQNGRLYGTTSDTAGNNLALTYTGYGGPSNYGRTLWYPISPGTISNKSLSVSNNSYNQPSNVDTSTCNTLPILYEWDTSLQRQGIEITRYQSLYRYRVVTGSQGSISSYQYDMPLFQSDRDFINALHLSNDKIVVFETVSGGAHVLQGSNGQKITELVMPELATTDGRHGKGTPRRIGNDLFVDTNRKGETIFFTLSFDTATNELTYNNLGKCITSATTSPNDTAHNIFLAGANNEYLVVAGQSVIFNYDLASAIDLSAY